MPSRTRNKPVKAARRAGAGQVRIIAGHWRSRRLPVADVPGLRPSSDRARETLFNWLQPLLPGAHCADLFAGTGALGLEAASRGAASVLLIENNRVAASQLQANIQTLAAQQVSLHVGDAMRWLETVAPASLDGVFVDPPFELHLQQQMLDTLATHASLRDKAFVYVESSQAAPAPVTPPGWTCWRERRVGEVRMQVFRRAPGAVE